MELQKPIYNRQDCDTDRSFIAFTDFLALRDRPRRFSHLHKLYLAQASADGSDPPPTTSYASIRTWSGQFKWTDRAIAWDKAQSARIMEKTLEGSAIALAGEHLKEINEYARTARQLGRGGANIALRLKKLISEAIFQPDFPKPRNAEEVATMIRAATLAENASMELWAQAIGIDKILSQADNDG
jgi:hypothetical protein